MSRAEGPGVHAGRDEDRAARANKTFTRRRLLSGGAAASLAAVVAGRPEGPTQLLMSLARDIGGIPIPKEEAKTFTFSVEREADLVLLDITFHGFLLNAGGGQVTSLVPASASNVIVVQFPPQAIGEAAYHYIEEPEWNVDPPPVLSVVAGPSRLAFTLNSGQQVDFPTMTPADLLDWSSWTLLVPAVAQVGASSTVGRSSLLPLSKAPKTKPSETTTAIEYPYALFIAPTVYTGDTAFGFSTTFAGRKEPLTGEHPAGGGYYGAPQVTGISDLWTAALQVSTYDHLEYERQFEFGAGLLDASHSAKPDIAISKGFGTQFYGVQALPPAPPRKPEVAAVWARDFEDHEPDGVTPWVQINYEAFAPPQIRRPANVRTVRAASAGTSLSQSTRVAPASRTRVAPASRTRRVRKVEHHARARKHPRRGHHSSDKRRR